MLQHCYHTPRCRLCAFGSKVFGHGLTYLLGKRWSKITIEQVYPHIEGLGLEIVGGLKNRGYTEHDIDVIGQEKDVSTLVKRLALNNINNLVHYCGSKASTHSHTKALINGFLVTFWGNKIYLKDESSRNSILKT